MENDPQDEWQEELQEQWQDKAMAALAIACQQRAFISHPGILCAAAATCTALSQAVQQCSGCHMEVVVLPTAPLPRLCSFAQWLPKHASLIKSLHIIAKEQPSSRDDGTEVLVHGLPWEYHLDAALLLLQEAVQLAATRPATAAAAGAAAAAVVQGQQQQQQHALRLGSFSSNWRGSPELLAALPAHSLTQLQLDLGRPSGRQSYFDDVENPWYAVNGALAAAALARLSSLQQLTLANTGHGCRNAASCLAAVAQRTRLTLLDLAACKDQEQWAEDGRADGELPQLMQVLLRLTQLRVLRLPPDETISRAIRPPLNLTHMTRLQELTLGSERSGAFTSVQFPAQLRQLDYGDMEELVYLETVMQLRQLQSLSFRRLLGCFDEPLPYGMVQQLLPLAQMPALQHLSIGFCSACVAAAAAPVWAQLPQLGGLTVREWDNINRQQWEAILAGLAAATSLTQLDLTALAAWYSREEAVAACGVVAGLTRLKDLRVRWDSNLVPGDAQALSALTGLTRLVLKKLDEGVGDEAAAAVVRSCQQLRHLDLRRCSLDSGTCLAEIGTLTQLTQLRLEGNEGIMRWGYDDMEVTQPRLMRLLAKAQPHRVQLAGLTQLQQLGVDIERNPTSFRRER